MAEHITNKYPDLVVRKARVNDVPAIAAIVNAHAETGVMLQRPVSRIYDNVRDFTVVVVGGEIVGCGSLHVMWADIAEIRSVAIKSDFMGTGLGRPLIEALIAEAEELVIEKVFVLTYRVDFFRYFAFTEIDKSLLPHKIWSECINCVHFPNCDETAMIRPVHLEGSSADGDECGSGA
jgi:amino-acid N-acetyltransferase